MEIGETLYVINRDDWRAWLEKNAETSDEIWLIYYNKKSGKPRIAYDEAVEEALCFGWIDSIVKKVDHDRAAQRFSPRRKKSQLSELNKVRIRRMIDQGKMTGIGLKSIDHHYHINSEVITEKKPFMIPDDILNILKQDALCWKHFKQFPGHYIQIRIGYIEGARSRPEEFDKRLKYFIKMTRQNKKFGSLTD